MSMNIPTVETLAALARQLPPAQRAWLIEQVAASLAEEPSVTVGQTVKSMRGLLAGFGPAPSAEDIEEMRRDMLNGFPREDIA